MSVKEAVSLVARQRGQGDSFWVLGDHYRFKVSSEETLGPLAIIEIIAFPQNWPPPHIRHHEDESLYVLDGAFAELAMRQVTSTSGACGCPIGCEGEWNV